MKVGFIGLGAMGGNMAANVLRHGHMVNGFDRDEARMQALVKAGGEAAANIRETVSVGEVVCTSLTDSKTLVAVAENEILPGIREGQVVVDLGTVTPGEARRLAELFVHKGARFLDVPVTGGVEGARTGMLRMFGGGDKEAFERIRPVLECMGESGYISHVGASGCGQIMKGVNQLAMGLVNAAILESLSFGVNAGLRIEDIHHLVGGTDGWRKLLSDACRTIDGGKADSIGVKSGQYRYFLDEAESRNIPLPMTQALQRFLSNVPLVTIEANRPSPSLWRELVSPEAGTVKECVG